MVAVKKIIGTLFRPPPLEAFKALHAGHGAGALKVVRVHVYDWWLCRCGARFTDPPRAGEYPS